MSLVCLWVEGRGEGGRFVCVSVLSSQGAGGSQCSTLESSLSLLYDSGHTVL